MTFLFISTTFQYMNQVFARELCTFVYTQCHVFMGLKPSVYIAGGVSHCVGEAPEVVSVGISWLAPAAAVAVDLLFFLPSRVLSSTLPILPHLPSSPSTPTLETKTVVEPPSTQVAAEIKEKKYVHKHNLHCIHV